MPPALLAIPSAAPPSGARRVDARARSRSRHVGGRRCDRQPVDRRRRRVDRGGRLVPARLAGPRRVVPAPAPGDLGLLLGGGRRSDQPRSHADRLRRPARGGRRRALRRRR